MVKAPVQVKEIFDVLKQFKSEADQLVKILVVHEAGVAVDDFIGLLALGGEKKVFQTIELSDSEESAYFSELASAISGADLSVLFLKATGELGLGAVSFDLIAKETEQPYLVVLSGTEQIKDLKALKEKVEKLLEMPFAEALLFAPDDKKSLNQLIGRMLKKAGKKMAIASRLPVFRQAAAEMVIARTAWQNAFLGAATILPGTDMPILTFNQIKMVLQIAAIYGEEMTVERAKELLAVVGGGFTFRTVARQLLNFVPGAGWIIKGGVAYGGTIAMGKAALAYFETGRYLSAEDIKTIVSKAARPKALSE